MLLVELDQPAAPSPTPHMHSPGYPSAFRFPAPVADLAHYCQDLLVELDRPPRLPQRPVSIPQVAQRRAFPCRSPISRATAR